MFSNLTNVFYLSPNFNERGNNEINTLIPHCTDGLMSWKGCSGVFGAGKNCSCNYLIDKDGIVCGVVDENRRSWCSSNRDVDYHGITFELASEKGSPCKMPDIVINQFINLCVDICKRYNKTKVVYFGDNDEQRNYTPKSNEFKIAFHKWFDKNRSCPEKYFISKCPEIVDKINKELSGVKTESTPKKIYCVQLGAFANRENAEKLCEELTKKGYTPIIK